MAAGRHGCYIHHEFRDRETDFRKSWGEIGYLNGEYDCLRKGKGDCEDGRGQRRGRGSLAYRGRVRHEHIKDREVMNGGYHSTSSRSDSGSNGGTPRSSGILVHPKDREPGELSSDGSDGAIDFESQVNKETEVKILENGSRFSHVQNKKRKFLPIVWNRDDREVSWTSKSKKVPETYSLIPAPPPLPYSPNYNSIPDATEQISEVEDSEAHISKPSPFKCDLLPDLSEWPPETETSSILLQEEDRIDDQRSGVYDDDDYVPVPTIKSSRWANDADSSGDEGEISYEDKQKLKRKFGSESANAKVGSKSVSPWFAEGSEGTRKKSSGSDERIRSSSRESYHEVDDKNDYMEVDNDQNYDSAANHSDTDSDDDLGSHGTPGPPNPSQRSVNTLQGCRNVDEFERLNKIDEGTYGIVFRAKDKRTGEVVALKKVKMNEKEGFPLTSLREINILLSLNHPSVVEVKEVVVGGNPESIFMVMEYMEHDLRALMETMKQPFSQSEVKCLMLQLLGGVKYLHDNWVLHRDLKTSNVLLNNCGELKICDFGLARQYGSPLKAYTQLVVTLWYRAPELLLGAKQYSTAIDMWSLGCIMAELLSKEPLFNGKSEVEQLDKIFKILGTPNETIWPGLSKLPGAKVNFVKHKYNLLRKKFPATSFTGSPVLSDAGLDLLNKLLTYDPEKRITAEAALNHEWFREVPLPKSKEFMPTFPAQHVQDRRMRRVMKSPGPLEEQRKELKHGELSIGGLFGQ